MWVKVDTQFGLDAVQVYVETVKLLLELVDKGFDLSIVRHGKVDLLEEYKENWLPYMHMLEDVDVNLPQTH